MIPINSSIGILVFLIEAVLAAAITVFFNGHFLHKKRGGFMLILLSFILTVVIILSFIAEIVIFFSYDIVDDISEYIQAKTEELQARTEAIRANIKEEQE